MSLQDGQSRARHPGGRSALPGVSRLPKFSERDCVPRTSRSNIQSRQRSRPHRSNRLPAVSFSLSAIRWEATFRESNVSSVFHFPERGCPHPQRPRKLSRKWTSSPPLRRKGKSAIRNPQRRAELVEASAMDRPFAAFACFARPRIPSSESWILDSEFYFSSFSSPHPATGGRTTTVQPPTLFFHELFTLFTTPGKIFPLERNPRNPRNISSLRRKRKAGWQVTYHTKSSSHPKKSTCFQKPGLPFPARGRAGHSVPAAECQ